MAATALDDPPCLLMRPAALLLGAQFGGEGAVCLGDSVCEVCDDSEQHGEYVNLIHTDSWLADCSGGY